MIRDTTTRARKSLTSLLAIGALLGAYCLATVGAFGVLMAAVETTALARGGGGHGGHGSGGRGAWHGGGGHAAWHGGGWHGGGWRGAYRVGGRYYGGMWYGPYWHLYAGRWWPYRIGTCWAPASIGWVWVCG